MGQNVQQPRGRTKVRPLSPSEGGGWVRISSLVALAVIWEFTIWAFEPDYLPHLSEVGKAFWTLATTPGPWSCHRDTNLFWEIVSRSGLACNLGFTLFRAAAGFFTAMIIGSVIGIVLGHYRSLDRFFDGWIVLGLNLPALVVGILCYVWFGLSEFALVLALAINKVPLVAVMVREGAASIQPDLIQVAKAFRMSWFQTMRKVYLPQLFPYFMASARAGLALIWKIVLVLEFIGRSNGVGFQFQIFFSNFEIEKVLAYTFSFIAVVMLIETFIMRPMDRKATRWRM
jgi:ABC-type nitrate/sulfonate/bicarbonate transport system permease component